MRKMNSTKGWPGWDPRAGGTPVLIFLWRIPDDTLVSMMFYDDPNHGHDISSID